MLINSFLILLGVLLGFAASRITILREGKIVQIETPVSVPPELKRKFNKVEWINNAKIICLPQLVIIFSTDADNKQAIICPRANGYLPFVLYTPQSKGRPESWSIADSLEAEVVARSAGGVFKDMVLVQVDEGRLRAFPDRWFTGSYDKPFDLGPAPKKQLTVNGAPHEVFKLNGKLFAMDGEKQREIFIQVKKYL